MKRIWDEELAALDFETTGLDPAEDRVIEVAVVSGRFEEAPRRWSTLVQPGRRVDATDIHGITDGMLVGQPGFADVAGRLSDELRGRLLVAHNARFDLAFLQAERERAGMTAPTPDALDSLVLSRRLLALPSCGLGAVVEHLGIERARAHRAADDAEATLEVAWRLFDRVDPGRILTLDEAMALGRRPSWAEQERLRATLLAAVGSAVVIDYVGMPRPEGAWTRRAITVRAVSGRHVEAFCHLRGEDRSFRLDRIRVVNLMR